MFTLNMLGRLGREWEIVQAGQATLYKNSCAIDKKVKGEKTTDWVEVVAFGKAGEILMQYTAKGCRIFVSGEPRARAYLKKGDANPVATLSVTVKEFSIIDFKDSGEQAKSQTSDKWDEDLPF